MSDQYTPISDAHLQRLKATVKPLIDAPASMTIPTRTLFNMLMELAELREEVFRLQLCETVEAIISEELETDLESGAFIDVHWPSEVFLLSDMRCYTRSALETERIVAPEGEGIGQSPCQDGRRLRKYGL